MEHGAKEQSELYYILQFGMSYIGSTPALGAGRPSSILGIPIR